MCHSNLPRQIHQYVLSKIYYDTAQKMKFSIKNFFSKSDQTAGICGFGHIYWRNP